MTGSIHPNGVSAPSDGAYPRRERRGIAPVPPITDDNAETGDRPGKSFRELQ